MTDEYQAWKASQAKQWAEFVRRSCIRLEQRQLALDELTALYDGIKAVTYTDMPGVSTREHGDDAMAAVIVQLEDMREEWKTTIVEFLDERREFERVLRMLDGRYDALLQARYIRNLDWQQVASVTNYTESYVRGELMTAALAALYDVMPNQYKHPLPRAF